jgi:hypothetical protein
MSQLEQKEMPEFLPNHIDLYIGIRNDILAKFRRHGVGKYLTKKKAKTGFMVRSDVWEVRDDTR